ncbi:MULTISPECIES: DUF2059 domain-containing protein [unclassified Roseitalea]|uniref:DUF2059 domain-containing protein n=1 Tax=unclassified Roseitalea TaxID=2639107 RepID=UPI00273D42C7|nr:MULTISPECIES: DUF2059 domain-containing protein [unclassified Roseitalea]
MSLRIVRNGLLAAAMGVTMAMGAAHAQQEISESHLQAGRDAIAAIKATERFDTILPEVGLALKERLIQSNPDLEAEIIQIVDETTLELAARRADLEREAAAIYARSINEEHLRQIADFYESEAGQALLDGGPFLARQVTTAASIWRRGIERDLLALVTRRMNEAGLRRVTAPDDAAQASE